MEVPEGEIILFLARRGRDRIHQGLWILLKVVEHKLPLFVVIDVLVGQEVELAISHRANRVWQVGRAKHGTGVLLVENCVLVALTVLRNRLVRNGLNMFPFHQELPDPIWVN